jgi:hypothetical protein
MLYKDCFAPVETTICDGLYSRSLSLLNFLQIVSSIHRILHWRIGAIVFIIARFAASFIKSGVEVRFPT